VSGGKGFRQLGETYCSAFACDRHIGVERENVTLQLDVAALEAWNKKKSRTWDTRQNAAWQAASVWWNLSEPAGAQPQRRKRAKG
jgi:hypothetical protein